MFKKFTKSLKILLRIIVWVLKLYQFPQFQCQFDLAKPHAQLFCDAFDAFAFAIHLHDALFVVLAVWSGDLADTFGALLKRK